MMKLKKFLKLTILIPFLLIQFSPVSAASINSNNSTNTLLTIDQPPAQTLNGEFYDDHLADELLPSGSLGELVFGKVPNGTTWKINPETFNEIFSMSNGYKLTGGRNGAGQELAAQWLKKLKEVVKPDSVFALPYGNPSGYWVNRLLTHDSNFVLNAGSQTLSKFFGFPVLPANSFSSKNYFPLNKRGLTTFTYFNQTIKNFALYLTNDQLTGLELYSNTLLRNDLTQLQITNISADISNYADQLQNEIYLSPAKFTVTSSNQKLPITLVNTFQRNAKVKLFLIPVNRKISTPSLLEVNIAARSKIQTLIPVHSLTSGISGIQISAIGNNGQFLSRPVAYPVNVKILNPIVTWITTLAAITLFVAVLIRNLRKFLNRKQKING